MGLFAKRHRYILRETLTPFLLGLAVFTFVLLMGRLLRLVEMVLTKGVPLADIVKLFVYLLPSFLVLTLPLAFLLGVLLGFGRLSTEAEVVALKSSGVSLYDMARPVFALALAVSLATGLLTLFAQPQGKRAFKEQVFHIAHSRATIGIQPRVFNDDFSGLMLYANAVDERSGAMEGLFISDQRLGDEPSLIIARNGRAIPDQQNLTLTLRLKNGAIHRQLERKGEKAYQVIDFDSYDIQLDLGEELRQIDQRRRKENELSLAELDARLADATGKERNKLLVERHQRMVLPLAPLLFAMIGLPLGIQSQRSSRGGGFALALGVFLVYYLVFSLAETLATEGNLSPALAMWSPNLLFFAIGAFLLHRTAREKRLEVLDRIDEGLRRLGRRLRRRRLK